MIQPVTVPTCLQRQITQNITNFKSGQTIYDLIDEAIDLWEGKFYGKPSKYLVFCYTGKLPVFDFEQPETLSMKKYFPLNKDSTAYKLIGVKSHSGEDSSSGHNLTYCLIEGEWFYFNDNEVYAISKCEIGKIYIYGWTGNECETAYLAFFEQIQEQGRCL